MVPTCLPGVAPVAVTRIRSGLAAKTPTTYVVTPSSMGFIQFGTTS